MFPTVYLFFIMLLANGSYYKTTHSKVSFESRATLEKIVATSNELKGIIDAKNNTFSFTVELESFHGFNSELQKDHYQENYVESDRYPKAIFSGRIIEEIDYSKPGVYEVRAKGNFELHGIRISKIIKSKLTIVNANLLKGSSFFELNLTEFGIKVPRLVHKKVAENIQVNIDFSMNKQ